jgi:hypothetical protein
MGPDSGFEPGRLEHVATGATGRMLDDRRTPVSIVGVKPDVGMFALRIEDFEDRGAIWEIPFESFGNFQFEPGGPLASPEDVARYRAAIDRFDRHLSIACDPERREATCRRIGAERAAATDWLTERSTFFASGDTLPDPETRLGDPRLQGDLRVFLIERGLCDLEEAFARRWVSNPYSGELVKGHRIVAAELGLAPYEGTIVRDPRLFDAAWNRSRRADHLIARMAFVHAALALAGLDRVVLYRGMSIDGPLEPPRNETFVAATFSRAVAESHFDSAGPSGTSTLLRQAVAADRVVMTYLETAAMNDRFLEAEAVLLFDAENRLF